MKNQTSTALLIASIAGFLAAGCATSNKAAKYLSRSSDVFVRVPIYVSWMDARPAAERAPPLDPEWIYTRDPSSRAAKGLAADVARVLTMKNLTSRVEVVDGSDRVTGDGFHLQLTLQSWYARVPLSTNELYGSHVARLIFGPARFYANGRCQISARIGRGAEVVDLGSHPGKAMIEVNRNATLAEEGRLVSAMAADRALADLIKRLERTLRDRAKATP